MRECVWVHFKISSYSETWLMVFGQQSRHVFWSTQIFRETDVQKRPFKRLICANDFFVGQSISKYHKSVSFDASKVL